MTSMPLQREQQRSGQKCAPVGFVATCKCVMLASSARRCVWSTVALRQQCGGHREKAVSSALSAAADLPRHKLRVGLSQPAALREVVSAIIFLIARF